MHKYLIKFSSLFSGVFLWISVLLQVLLSKDAISKTAQTRILLDQLEASVNTSIILRSDIKIFKDLIPLRLKLDPLFADSALAKKGDQASREEIVTFLIQEKLITLKYPNGDLEIEQEINTIQNNHHMSREQLIQVLGQEGFSLTQYREILNTSLSIKKLINRDIQDKVKISEDDIKNYFHHQYVLKHNTPRAFHLKMISKTFQKKSPLATQKNAIQALKKALQEIQNGESFESVSERHSDDFALGSGGDLGILTEEEISPLIREGLNTIQEKIGAMSPILCDPTAERCFILKVIDIQSDQSDKLEKMRDPIFNHLTQEAYKYHLGLWIDKEQQSAFIHRAGEPTTAPKEQSSNPRFE